MELGGETQSGAEVGDVEDTPLYRLRQRLWPYRLCLSFLGFCALVLITILIIHATAAPWPPVTFTLYRCEKATEDAFLREPLNAISNVVYFYAGCYVSMCAIWDAIVYPKVLAVYRERGDRDDVEGPQSYCAADFPLALLCFGVGQIMIGSMSFWYHACTDACPDSGFYDVYAVYVTVFYMLFLITLVLLYVSKAFTPSEGDWKTRRAVDIVFAGIFGLSAGLWLDFDTIIQKPLGGADNVRLLLIGLFAYLVLTFIAGVVVATCRKLQPNYAKSTLSLVLFFLITGVVSWLPEEVFGDCSVVEPDFFFQLHAYWHVGLALALLFGHIYLRSLSNKTLKLQGGFFAHMCLKEIGDLDLLVVHDGSDSESSTTKSAAKKPEL